jgi:hypothetical protein
MADKVLSFSANYNRSKRIITRPQRQVKQEHRRPTAIRLAVAISCLLICAGWHLPAQARTCSQVHNGCVAKCMRLGIGAARKRGIPQPMPADVCQAHCIGWTNECKRTGCFNGDLHRECGLDKR